MEATGRDDRLAVVIITHNRIAEVRKTLTELARLPEHPHVILVDNASTDETVCRVADEFPEVEVIALELNLGGAARTVGARRTDAPYIAFCDNDTWWQPGSLRGAIELLAKHPRLAVIAARTLVGPERRDDPINGDLERSPLPRDPGMPGPPVLGFLAGGSVIRRSAYLEVGGFEPRFLVGGEEQLLAADLAPRGWWICYVPEVICFHHPSPSRDPSRRRMIMIENAL